MKSLWKTALTFALLLTVLFSTAQRVYALEIVDAIDMGWWGVYKNNTPDNENYLVGQSSHSVLRNFFSFQLPNLDSKVVSAQLEVSAFDVVLSKPREYRLYDVSTDFSVLNSPGSGNSVIYDDLGTGVLYGTYLADIPTGSYSDELTVSINLNQAAVKAINNSLGSLFAIGGDLIGAEEGDGYQYLFGGSGDPFEVLPGDIQRLVLDTQVNVPEPTTIFLFSAGLMGFIARKIKIS